MFEQQERGGAPRGGPLPSAPPLEARPYRPTDTRRWAGTRWLRREWVIGYLFISPWLIGMVVFYLGPVVASLVLSFTNYPIIAGPRWTGLSNYQQIAGDPQFVHALQVSTIYTILALIIYIGAALALALLANKRVPGVGIFRMVVFLPSLIPIFVAALLWGWLFQPDFGLVNYALGKAGVTSPPLWFQSTSLALPLTVTLSFWTIGSAFLTFLAGLQAIPTDLYDAATVDGAGGLRKFRHVTFPMLSPVILFNLIIGITISYQVFDVGYVLTQGGPGDATLFFVLYVFRQGFENLQMGYASALAWILFLLIVAITALVFRSARWWVHYEAAGR